MYRIRLPSVEFSLLHIAGNFYLIRTSKQVCLALILEKKKKKKIYSRSFDFHFTGFAVFSICALSDMFDGYIARNFNQQTKLGSFLDPVADKLLMTISFSCLGYVSLLPMELVALILVRDVTLLQGAAFHRYRSLEDKTLRNMVSVGQDKDINVVASPLSKFNTVLQAALVIAVLESASFGYIDGRLIDVLVPVVASTTLFSGAQYFFKNPFQSLTSVGMSEAQESTARAVNVALLSTGFVLFGMTLYTSFKKMSKPD